MERLAATARSEVIRLIERAVTDRLVVDLQYLDRDLSVTFRSVEAHGVHVAPQGSYLIGWCRLRDDARAFRLDRIGSIRLTDETAPERDIEVMLDWLDGQSSLESMMMASPTSRRRSAGPPARLDDQTGANPAFAAAVAIDLPAVTVTGRTFATNAQVFLDLSDDNADLLLDADRELFRVALNRIPRDELRELIRRAWRNAAPRRAHAVLERRLAKAPKPIRLSDIEAIIVELPGVTRRIKPRSADDAVLWEASKIMFVKYGEASNLLAPDVNDTLMIRRCPDRPSLLASSPLRFFITRHYGDPNEPGPVLTRLSENSHSDLPELRELIVESWRDAAPKRTVAAFDAAHDQPRRRDL